MKTLLFLASSILVSQASIAFPGHTGYCYYGEPCGGIVSTDLKEAQRICAKDPFDQLTKAVYQEQADGSVEFIGYVCVGISD